MKWVSASFACLLSICHTSSNSNKQGSNKDNSLQGYQQQQLAAETSCHNASESQKKRMLNYLQWHFYDVFYLSAHHVLPHSHAPWPLALPKKCFSVFVKRFEEVSQCKELSCLAHINKGIINKNIFNNWKPKIFVTIFFYYTIKYVENSLPCS